MSKVLMVATVPSMIGQFNIENMRILQELGYDVEVACNFRDRSVWSEERTDAFASQMRSMGISMHQIDFPRNPTNVRRVIRAGKQLDRLLKNKKYIGLHCHTPVAAALARMAAHRYRVKSVYTAHGFHFYRGAAWKNWVLFYPVEKMLSRWTDALITINLEDYERAKNFFHAKLTVYMQGVGICTERFSQKPDAEQLEKLRTELGIRNGETAVLSVGELSVRKNHEQVIRALAHIRPLRAHYYVVGQGDQTYLEKVIREEHMESQVTLLGFRTDIAELLHAADLFVLPSLQEGLPVALMEALASGIPCLASKIRGNVDLQAYGVKYFDLQDQKGLERQLSEMIEQIAQGSMDHMPVERDVSELDTAVISAKMKRLYQQTFGKGLA